MHWDKGVGILSFERQNEVMYWTGYVYRYWHYDTNETSKEIYEVADAEMMKDCWLGFHTLDVLVAIGNLKEIHKQKNACLGK